MCATSSSVCPEYRSSSPVDNLNWPEPIHLHSLIPRIDRLYLLISLATCNVFPDSSMVLTFHVPIIVVVLVDTTVIGLVASRDWLSLHSAMNSPAGDPSFPRSGLFKFLVDVFVAVVFLTG